MEGLLPPAISTFPEGKSVAVAQLRAVFIVGPAAKLLVAGS